MRSVRVVLIAIAILSLATTQSRARIIALPTYQKLLDESDLVVIATAISRTADTNERAFLPGIFYQDPDGKQRPIASIGVETMFSVCAVLKGNSTVKQLTLHHYREAGAPGLVDEPPSLVSFDPADSSAPRTCLLFLVRETDGR